MREDSNHVNSAEGSDAGQPFRIEGVGDSTFTCREGYMACGDPEMGSPEGSGCFRDRWRCENPHCSDQSPGDGVYHQPGKHEVVG